MIKIYDDIISNDLQDEILTKLRHGNFPWFLSHNTLGSGPSSFIKNNIKEYLQFEHYFYHYDNDDGKTYSNSDTTLIDKLLNEIANHFKWNKFEIIRVKSNLQTQCENNKKEYYNSPHVDFPNKNLKTMIYYINDSDGDTFFFDNEENLNIIDRVEPKKGRLVLFDGNILHSGQHPIQSETRMVLNINFNNE